MNRFDDDLRMALRREEPSPDFAARVMARIQSLEQAPATKNQKEKLREKYGWRRRLADFFRPPALKWAMAAGVAVVLIAAAVGVGRYREHQRVAAELAARAAEAANAEGQRAKEQVMLAMRIASAKLNVAARKVEEAAHRDEEQHPAAPAERQPN